MPKIEISTVPVRKVSGYPVLEGALTLLENVAGELTR